MKAQHSAHDMARDLRFCGGDDVVARVDPRLQHLNPKFNPDFMEETLDCEEAMAQLVEAASRE